MIWIRSHSDIRVNELADELEKRAAENRAIGPEPFLPVSYSLVKKEVSNWLVARSKLNWQGNFRCEQTKAFVSEPHVKVTKQIASLTKKDTRIAVGLITGHAKTNYHLRKMGLRDDPDCRLCGRDSETATHIICACETLKGTRSRTFGNDEILPRDALNLHKIVKFYLDACGHYHSIKQIFDID